jgi:hypothetical protein
VEEVLLRTGLPGGEEFLMRKRLPSGGGGLFEDKTARWWRKSC